jgi:hypothetical protein
MSMQTFARPREAIRQPNASPKFARSGQMVDSLRKEWIYSEKRPRDVLFNAIEQVITTRPPMMVSQLAREAARLARQLSSEAGFEFENWDVVTKAVMKTLLMARALETPDGDVIPFDITAQASVVGALCEDYRDRSEAFLLEFLIRRLGDVTTKDHTALAHALFRQFDARIRLEDLEDRVVVLLARLAKRVALSNDVYELRTFEPA